VVTYGTPGFPQLVELRLKASSSGVSPFRQSATSHMFRSYLFNGYRRLAAQLPYWVIPVGIGGLFVMSLSHLLTDMFGHKLCRLQRLCMGQEERRVAE
jgi:hypothetical protein